MPTKPRLPRIDPKVVQQELARRKGLVAEVGSFRLEDYLFDKQLSFVLDPATFKVAVTTRRAGKTISCVADLLHTAKGSDACVVLYITKSRKNAKRLVWPECKKLNNKFALGGVPNESDLSMAFPNGSILYLLGASDRTSIEDFRGLAIKKVYLDETQSFPSYIEELIDEVLAPALMDHNGSLILIGTPGPIPSGYFYDTTKNGAWSHHSWSYWDNPKLPYLDRGISHGTFLQSELKRRGVTIDDPSIRREFFGEWVKDENSLVYQYNQVLNDFTEAPKGPEWTYILGVDLGYEDCDALALLCYSEQSPNTYLIEEKISKHQDITSLVAQITDIESRYPLTKIVVDTGGLGKKITEEISKRFLVPMVPAEKSRKIEYIELMNDALRTGRLKIKASSKFAHDAMKVEWDHDHSTPEKKVVSKRNHSDICDAVLYVWRESYAFSYQPPKEELEFGTKRWSDAQGDMMFQAELERLEAEKEERGEPYEPEFDPINDKVQSIDRPKGRYHDRFNRKKQ